MTDQEFARRMEAVNAGYELWKDIVERHQLSKQDFMIAFPHEEDPVNECGIAHLEQFMKYSGGNGRVLLLCVGNSVSEMLRKKALGETVTAEILEKQEMEGLVALYSIENLSPHFIMMSLTTPYGRYGDRALKKGLTLDEVVTVGIYRMTGNEVYDKHKS